MPFWVYILRSKRNGKLYIGQTGHMERRLAEHNEGRGGKFTRLNGPWELMHKEAHENRTSAVRRERFLKSVSGSREKRRLAQHGA